MLTGGFISHLTTSLSYTCQIGKPVKDLFSQITTLTSITTTACFAYQGDWVRTPDGKRLDLDTTWHLILPSSLSSVSVDDRVQNVTDDEGRVVIVSGTIAKVAQYEHWDYGMQFFDAALSPD